VSCKAYLAALRLYGYFCDFFCFVFVSENKYDDDDEYMSIVLVMTSSRQNDRLFTYLSRCL